jgi:hypothetical protein
MVTPADPSLLPRPGQSKGAVKRWLVEGYVKEIEGPFEREKEHYRQHAWHKVMCLTGVDYFSTLGYQTRHCLSRRWPIGVGSDSNPCAVDAVRRTPNLSSSR